MMVDQPHRKARRGKLKLIQSGSGNARRFNFSWTGCTKVRDFDTHWALAKNSLPSTRERATPIRVHVEQDFLQPHQPAERHQATTSTFTVRPLVRQDYAEWRALWDGYNAFYGRDGASALLQQITDVTWERFFNPSEPVHAFVVEDDGHVIGLVHYLFHRSTTRLHDVCYLQDLFTAESRRGKGIGRLLIHAVYESARAAGSSRVYWTTQLTNHAGRALYDKVAQHSGFIVYSHEL